MRPLVTERMRCRARSRTRTRHLPWRPRGCPTCAGFRCESGARESPCTLATTVTARSTVMAIRESKSEYDRDRCDIPEYLRPQLAEMGFFGITIPPGFGGPGDCLYDCFVMRVLTVPPSGIFEVSLGNGRNYKTITTQKPRS